MPGKNETSAPLAQKVDVEYSLNTLDWFFGGFVGMRWERIVITYTDLENKFAKGTVWGTANVGAMFGPVAPVVGESWWAICEQRTGIFYLDDIAR